MLSDDDKKQMREDAQNEDLRKAFADATARSHKPTTWANYFSFLKSIQNLFPQQRRLPKKIEGNFFKL
jgi:hypothetical protein